MPAALQKVAFEQRLNEQLPLDLPFKDEDGRTVKLGDYFGTQAGGAGVRVLRVPDAVHAGAQRARERAARAQRDRSARSSTSSTVSFDPRETPVLAAGKKKAYLDRYKRPSAEQGWHFLTGDEASIDALTKAAASATSGTKRRSSSRTPAASSWRRRTGKLSRYFFGIDYSPRDVKFALIESSDGRIGTLAEQLLLYCYHYDPATGQLRVRGDARGADWAAR